MAKETFQFLNRIQLRGIVGYSRRYTVADDELVRFSLSTSYEKRSREGGAAILTTTWFEVSAFKSEVGRGWACPSKGDIVEVSGRVKVQRHLSVDGSEKTVYEVLAQQMTVLAKQGESTITFEKENNS